MGYDSFLRVVPLMDALAVIGMTPVCPLINVPFRDAS